MGWEGKVMRTESDSFLTHGKWKWWHIDNETNFWRIRYATQYRFVQGHDGRRLATKISENDDEYALPKSVLREDSLIGSIPEISMSINGWYVW